MMKRTRTVAYGGIVSALSVVLLLVASYIEVVDLSAVMLVSLGIVLMQIEFGTVSSLTCFAAVSVLSILLLPQKIPALMYICFGGWYPIAKCFIERLNTVLSYLFKFVSFNAAIVLYWYLTVFVFMIEQPDDLIKIALFAAANVAFLLYDFVLSRLITYYVRELRFRLSRKK